MNRYFFSLLALILFITPMTQCSKDTESNTVLKKSKEASIISFELGTYKGKLNGTSLSIELPYGTDISSLSAKVKLSESATIKPDPKTVKDWSTPVSFTVTAENGESKKYTVTVKILRPVLTFEKLTKEYTKGGRLNATEILKHVKGEKASYTLKEITNLNPNDIVRVNGTAPNLRLEFNRVGVFTALLRLKHNATSDLDVTISNAEFEITKRAAPSLTWTKQTKPFSSGGEITNVELLAGVTGSGKTGYTIKTVSISNAGGTGARVSGSGTAAKIVGYTRAGKLTLSLVFEHDTKADKTITGAAFEITNGDVPLSWSRQSKVYGYSAEISNAALLGGMRGTKTGYRIKSVQITNDSGGSGARVSGSGTAAKIVGYGKATILTLTLVLQHATKAEKTIRGAQFEITKMIAPINLNWVKQLKTYRSGEEISNFELLSGLEGSKVGYRIKSVAITSDSSSSGARVSGSGTVAKIVNYSKATILTLTLVFEHDTKADKTITGAQFEITSGDVPLSWSRQSKVYSVSGEISNAELLGGVRGTKDGYRIKTVQITGDSSSSGARVSGSGTTAKIVGYGKATILTLTLVLQHATKAEKTLSNVAFEIRKMPVPVDLSWRKQSKVYRSSGEISNAELLRGLSGTKTGYRVKTLTISDSRGTGARVLGNGISAKIVGYTKVGTLTLSIVFEHDTKEDKNITGAEFEITKASAPRLTWTKQTKPFSSGGEITNTNLLAGVTGSGKTGYTIKTVNITNTNGTGARVSGSGRAAKITSYTKVGTLTLTLVLAHDTKDDVTLRNAQFEITKASAPRLSWTKQTKPFSSSGEITNTDLLAGVTGSGKNGYTIKTVTITSTNGTGASVSGVGRAAKITSYTKIGTLMLTLVLAHDTKNDVTLRNAQFEIAKASAPRLSWTKQTKAFSSGGEITNADLLTGVTGTSSDKAGYTIKTVTITNKNGTSATVSGSGTSAKIRSYTKAGTLIFTIVLQHDTKDDVTIRNAQLHIYRDIFTISSGGQVTLKASVDKKSLTTVTIPYMISGTIVTSIGNRAFMECSELTSVTIPNSVNSIGNSVFSSCSKLTRITIPNSVNSIGTSAFYRCSSLTNITIPNSVTSIADSLFWDCTSLTNITIGNSVTSIGDAAFHNCRRLTSITIGNSVTSIGMSAFYNCISLTSITLPNSITTIGAEPFDGCFRLTTIRVPNAKVTPSWSDNLKKGNKASVVGY